MIGYIYSLSAKKETDVFYIGASFNPTSRLKDHKSTYPFWVFDCNIRLDVIEEVEVSGYKDLFKIEAYWIQQFLAWGFKLENIQLHYGVNVKYIKQQIEFENELNSSFADDDD